MLGFKSRQRTEFIVIHCSRTHPEQLGIAGKPYGYKDLEWKYALRGVACGYHWVIQRDGSAIADRPDTVAGNHCPGVNGRSVGICLIGGLSINHNFESNFTEDQWATLRQTVEYLLRKFPHAKVVGHSNVAGKRTECPSFNVCDWWGHIQQRKQLKENANDPSRDPAPSGPLSFTVD